MAKKHLLNSKEKHNMNPKMIIQMVKDLIEFKAMVEKAHFVCSLSELEEKESMALLLKNTETLLKNLKQVCFSCDFAIEDTNKTE